MATEKVVLQIVAEGADKATKQVADFGKSVNNVAGKTTSGAFNQIGASLGKVFDKVGNLVPGMGQLTGAFKGASGAAGVLGSSMGGLAVSIGLVAAAAAAAAIAMKIFISTGLRGAQVDITAQAFGNLSGQFGNATKILGNLRKSTQGTISDFQLMRLYVNSLQGASKEMGDYLSSEFGNILNDTRKVAIALGRDPAESQERFIMALKKGNRELLDELGIIVSAEEANKTYAQSIGKTAAALTDQEKRTAFAIEAIRQLKVASQQVGADTSILDVFARLRVLFQNIKDQIAVAIQPMFKVFSEFVDDLIAGVQTIANVVIPIFASLVKIIGTALSEAYKFAKAAADFFFGDLFSIVGAVLPYVIAMFEITADAISDLLRLGGLAIRQFIARLDALRDPVRKFAGGTVGTIGDMIKGLAYMMGYGGGAVIGAFATGILKAGIYVEKAVTAIATIVADFLVGFSPPKMGPLAQIDEGGLNTALAWLDGFTNGLQKPVNEVAQFVETRLGNIATFTRNQVAARFAQLDAALQPFKDSVSIIKADLEAINGIVSPALESIDRQRERIIKTFQEGNIGDITRLRVLDQQAEKLKELQDLEQGRLDNVQIQYAIAASQQAQERALLSIQQARLGEEKQLTDAKTEAARAASAAAAAGRAGAPTTEEVTGVGLAPGEAADILGGDLRGKIDAAKEAIRGFSSEVKMAGKSGISAGWGAMGAPEALAEFKRGAGALAVQTARIKGADPVGSLLEKFTGLKDGLAGIFDDVKEAVSVAFSTMFNDPGLALDAFSAKISGTLGALPVAVEGALKDFKTAVVTPFANLFGSETGSISLYLNSFKNLVTGIFGGGEAGETSIFSTALANVTTFFEDFTTLLDEKFPSINGAFDTFKTFASEAITTVKDTLAVDLVGAIDTTKSAVENGVNTMLSFFTNFAGEGVGSVKDALKGLGTALNNALIAPIEAALQYIANGFVSLINSLLDEADKIPGVDAKRYKLSEISIKLPRFEAGGLGIQGAFLAGERGAELVAPHGKVDVFPAAATRALMSIAAMPMRFAGTGNFGGGSTTNNTNFNSQITVNSPQQAMLIQRQQLSMMRG